MVKIPRALFVSGIDGFCHRYAVLHRARHLRACGWEVSVLPYRHPELGQVASQAKIVFFYRVPANLLVMRMLDQLIGAGTRCIGLVDDLIFRAEEDLIPSFVVRDEDRSRWQEGAHRYAEVLHHCDEVLASSEELVGEVRALGRPSHLYRDAMAVEEFALAQNARRIADQSAARGEFRVGYFSGTATHGEDFCSLAAGLALAMRDDPTISLRIRGPLAIPAELSGFSHRISHGSLVPWVDLPTEIAAVDLNLAPLDTRSRFAAAKGATKVMEAGACGVASIASPTSSHRAAIAQQGGWIAETAEQWAQTILDASAARSRVLAYGGRARAHMAENYSEGARLPLMRDLIARSGTEVKAPVRSRGSRVESRLVTIPDEPASQGALVPDAFPILAERPVVSISPPIGEGDVLLQDFCLARPGLDRLDLFSLTYGQIFDHSIGLRIADERGHLRARGTWDASCLPDHGFFLWELEAPLEAGRFFLELEAHGTGPGNAASFGLIAAGEDRAPATINGFEISGALGLRGFSSWDQIL